MSDELNYCDNCSAKVGGDRLTQTSNIVRGDMYLCPYCYNSPRLSDPSMQAICHLMNVLEDRIVKRLT